MRVDEPKLSMVAIVRSWRSGSGASRPSARHAPLNSSISAASPSISCVMATAGVHSISHIHKRSQIRANSAISNYWL